MKIILLRGPLFEVVNQVYVAHHADVSVLPVSPKGVKSSLVSQKRLTNPTLFKQTTLERYRGAARPSNHHRDVLYGGGNQLTGLQQGESFPLYICACKVSAEGHN